MEAIALPNRAKVEHLGNNKYNLILEPLYPGYGVTIGNALRRVLLSSLPGAAVTAVKIKYVDHEFSTIPNIKEDVIQIILNLKQLRIKSYSDEPVRVSLKAKGEKVITSADIKTTDSIEIFNKDQHIATLDNKNAELDMELIVERGRGYLPVEARENKKLEIGMIAIDSIFTPVRSVYFDVSNVRVGQLTNYDKLVINLETDGTITGEEVFNIASHILVDHFTMIFSTTGNEVEIAAEKVLPAAEAAQAVVVDDSEITSSALSNRAKNALVKNNIRTLAALRALTNEEIENLRGLGDKSIKEIIEFLGRV